MMALTQINFRSTGDRIHDSPPDGVGHSFGAGFTRGSDGSHLRSLSLSRNLLPQRGGVRRSDLASILPSETSPEYSICSTRELI